MIECIRTCACGGIGRHARFRILCASVQVQVLSGAPKNGRLLPSVLIILILQYMQFFREYLYVVYYLL